MNVERLLATTGFHTYGLVLYHQSSYHMYIPLAGSAKHSHIVCLYLNNNCNSFHRHMSRSLGRLFLAKHLLADSCPHAYKWMPKPSWTKECAGQTKDLGNKLEFGTMSSIVELQSKNSVVNDQKRLMG